MRKSIVIAAVLAVAVVGWVLSGQINGNAEQSRSAEPAAVVPKAPPPARVRVAHLTAEAHMLTVSVRGRTEASREIELRAETAGRIVAELVRRGDRVAQGQLLGRLALDDREAKLAEYNALLRQREIEFDAATQLSGKGFRSNTELAGAKAQLDAARAQVERMKIDIDHTLIRAPIDGIVDRGKVQLGDYVQVGDLYGTIIDLDPVLLVGNATEREVGFLQEGMLGRATTLDGHEVEGAISYIAHSAEPETRTYRFELEADNPDGIIRDGLTADIVIPVSVVTAHFVSPAVLTLGDNGIVGVKAVDAQNRVVFHPIRIVKDTPTGIWLADLPAEILLITVGQEFVVPGQVVEPVEAPSPIVAGSTS